MISGYQYKANRWQALRDAIPLGIRVRGELSPHFLAQELVSESWQVLIGCVLLSRRDRASAHPALWRLLNHSLGGLASMGHAELESTIRRCGLPARRTTAVSNLSRQLLTMDLQQLKRESAWPKELGEYARDSWAIFVEGRDDVKPLDAELIRFLHWSYDRKGAAFLSDKSRLGGRLW